ncbi:MAG: cytochrome c-type biogenesis protein [Ketobacteraceae bacterium]|nr:cytochrome c-type biogenesis protein [Ketobacteraceae bacterium]
MSKRYLNGLPLILLLMTLSLQASINVYEFEDEDRRQRFDQLIDELRCPKCQNQNIADSDAGVAKLIKDRVYKLVQEGKSKEEITDHMVARYGDFVTYRPPLKTSTLLLWFGPVAALLIAVIALVIYVRRNSRAPVSLSDSEHEKVEALLKKYNPDDDKSQS